MPLSKRWLLWALFGMCCLWFHSLQKTKREENGSSVSQRFFFFFYSLGPEWTYCCQSTVSFIDHDSAHVAVYVLFLPLVHNFYSKTMGSGLAVKSFISCVLNTAAKQQLVISFVQFPIVLQPTFTLTCFLWSPCCHQHILSPQMPTYRRNNCGGGGSIVSSMPYISVLGQSAPYSLCVKPFHKGSWTHAHLSRQRQNHTS